MRKVPQLGELTQNATIPEWWESQPVSIPFLTTKAVPFILTLHAENNTYPSDVGVALERFLTLGDPDRALAAEKIFEYYTICADDCSESELGINHPDGVWEYLEVKNVHVQRKGITGKYVYIVVDCSCEWEHEHGLQLLYRRGHELIEVGEQDDGVTYSSNPDT